MGTAMRKAKALAAGAALILAGCGERAADNGATANASGSAVVGAEGPVGTLLAGDAASARLHRIVAGAGMTELLNGVGPYTLFAPSDAALDGLGEGRVEALAGEAMRPQAIALLRAHIVPGAITRQDIQNGLASGRPVQLRTMADTVLTLSREGETIVVTSDRGGRATLSGEGKIAANGAVHPIDGVLLPAG
jgi:uncharacterized surface protein with fasciclin (FAS1) repeats